MTDVKILILDGILGNHKRWEKLRVRLSESVAESIIWKYDNSGMSAPSELAKDLAGWVEAQDSSVAFVGYSMGGIVVREAARLLGDRKIKAAALLHCPHQGTLLGKLGQLASLPAARELATGSEFLNKLPNHKFPILATWCPYDLVILPGNSASMACEQNLRVNIPAHNAPVWAEVVHRAVEKFLHRHIQST